MFINIFFLFAVLITAVLVILPFVYLGSRRPTGQPGIAHQSLAPGFRRYTIAIPQSYTGEKPVPLVVALHYGGHGTPYFGEWFLIGMVEPALRELGAVIVAPDCPEQDWLAPKSEQLILDLLADLKARFNLNPKQILLVGYSLGGVGAWHFAARYPEHFSAAIIMAAPPPAAAPGISWQIPLLVIHARYDESFPLSGVDEAVRQLEARGLDVQLRIVERGGHHDTALFVPVLRNAIPWVEAAWGKAGEVN